MNNRGRNVWLNQFFFVFLLKKSKMKRFLLSLVLIFCAICTFGQTVAFETTHFSYKDKTAYGGGTWTQWSPSSSLMTIDYTNDMIVIYTKTTQYYSIVSVGSHYRSGNAEIQEFGFIDQDGDRGTCRLVMRDTGRSEIYFSFLNIIFGYIVIRK